MKRALRTILDADWWGDVIESSPRLDIADLAPRGSRLLVLSVHPDDETVGAGRLAAGWARVVGPVDALLLSCRTVCTAGDSTCETSADSWRAAVRDLGGTALDPVEIPIDDLVDHDDTIHDIVVGLSQRYDAMAAPWLGDPQSDHIAAGRAIARAARDRSARMLWYPIWMTYWTTPAAYDITLTRIDVGAEDHAARAGALTRYRDQLDGDDPIIPGALLAQHREQLLVDLDEQ